MNSLDTPLAFLLSRRSTPVRQLQAPAPDDATLQQILTAAARVPDHGKLVPFRFHVLRPAAQERMIRTLRDVGSAQGREPETLTKNAQAFIDAPLTIAVLCHPNTDSKIPVIEQEHAASNACFNLLSATLASGFGGNWITGWMARDPAFLKAAFDLAPPASITGFLHLGTPKVPPTDRPRPDLDAITTWVTE